MDGGGPIRTPLSGSLRRIASESASSASSFLLARRDCEGGCGWAGNAVSTQARVSLHLSQGLGGGWLQRDPCQGMYQPAARLHTWLNTPRKAARLYSYMTFSADSPAMAKYSAAPRVATGP